MIRRYRFHNGTDLTREQIISLTSSQLPYGIKFIELRPSKCDLYDYLLVVELSEKYIRDHS